MSKEKSLISLVSAGVTASVLLAIASTDSQPANVSASSKDPIPTPSSNLFLAGGMPSKKDIRQLAQQIALIREVSQPNPGHLEFDVTTEQGVDHYIWDMTNTSPGISPNSASIRTGTVRVAINDVWRMDKDFQGLQSLAPYQPLLAQTIGGLTIIPSCNRYLLAEGELRNDATYNPYLESGSGITTAEEYTDREVVWKGLPKDGLRGRYTPISVNGSHVRITFDSTDTINSTEAGNYEIVIDNNCKFVGDTFTKLSEPATPTATIPVPTYTPSPTSTAIAYNTPTVTTQSYRLYLPNVVTTKP